MKWAESLRGSSPPTGARPSQTFGAAYCPNLCLYSSEVMKAKNLVEIVGQEDFFVWLHGIFCGLLHSLINQYGQLSSA